MAGIFLFEYATCGAFPELEPSITVEGMGMFRTLFQGFAAMGRTPAAFVDRRIPGFEGLPKVEDYHGHFEEYLGEAGAALVVAPESGMAHYGLTKTLEESGTANLGPGSGAVLTTSDKWLTYRKLKDLMPRTETAGGSTALEFPLVAKPRDGTSCEGIFMVRDEAGLQGVPDGYLLQEFVQGRAMSASVLCGDETRILSIQTQEISGFRYMGAMVPGPEVDTEPVLRAVERITGLFGLVGVDFVDTPDGVRVVEINARPTTPIIAFERAYGLNVSEAIYRNYYGGRLLGPKGSSRVLLKKVRGDGGVVSFGGYAIRLEVRV
ncbi:MAG: ATP-grasp domain-containing protein [Euryarchaeota archaeon]|nr:ATP-grasp domain-containing protein [Euryarchaeota archaeon]